MIYKLLLLILTAAALLAGAAAGPATHTFPPALFDASMAQQVPSAYTPQQIQTAYDFNPLYQQGIDGSGQTVALLEIDRYFPADMQTFDTAYNLPAPSVKEYYVDGQGFSLGANPETMLDVEWLHALAPGAAIQVYYLDNNQSMSGIWQSTVDALHQAAANGANTVSVSLGACKAGRATTQVQAAFAALAQQGVSIFVASGDSGAYNGSKKQCGSSYKIGVAYPSGDPSVVSVGGTTLHLNADSSIAHETAWSLSGGGKIKILSRPFWQVAPSLPMDNSRWAPDVAFLGNQNTGVSVYGPTGRSRNHRWLQIGGTSLGAPAWAGIWSLIRQSTGQANITLGAADPLLYGIGNSAAYAQAFHDIISGSNGHYRAAPGWDAVTGWGTPDVANLVTAVQAAVQNSSPGS